MEKAFPILLMLEIVLPLLALVLVLGLALMRARKLDRKGIRELIARVQAKESSRKVALQDFLAKRMGFSEPDLSQRLSLIESQRKGFYKSLIQAFMRHDAAMIAALDEPLDTYIDAYHVLAHEASPAVERAEPASIPQTVGDDGAAAELAALRRENKRLRQEAQITLSTLNNIFAEYTSMFGEQTERAEMSVEEIIEAMEKYSGRTHQHEGAESPLREEEHAYIRGVTEPAPPSEAEVGAEPGPWAAPEREAMPASAVGQQAMSEDEALAAAWERQLLGEEGETPSEAVEPAAEPVAEQEVAPRPAEEPAAAAAFESEALPEEEALPEAAKSTEPPEAQPFDAAMEQDDLDLLFQKAKEDAERNG